MISRLLMVGAAALIGPGVSAAEPTQAPRDVQAAQASPPRLLLASADEVRMPAPASQQTPAPAKRPRIARVTTCRCGDPAPQDEQQQ